MVRLNETNEKFNFDDKNLFFYENEFIQKTGKFLLIEAIKEFLLIKFLLLILGEQVVIN